MTFDASKELPRPSQRLALWVAAVGVGFVAGATYLAVRSSCVARDRGLRGEGMGSRGGKLLYFNGQCWTPEPLPPADTRF